MSLRGRQPRELSMDAVQLHRQNIALLRRQCGSSKLKPGAYERAQDTIRHLARMIGELEHGLPVTDTFRRTSQ